MITQQQVDDAKSLLLMIVNQAMARGLFNNVEDMPKVIAALNLPQKLLDELITAKNDLFAKGK